MLVRERMSSAAVEAAIARAVGRELIRDSYLDKSSRMKVNAGCLRHG